MALTSQQEAEIVKLLDQGNKPSQHVLTAYETFINNLSKEVRDIFKKVINDNSRSNSGNLANSVEVLPIKTGFEIEADLYYKFVDEGVSGVGGQIKGLVQGTPYKFKHLGVSRQFLSRIQEFTGSDMNRTFATAINIKKRGIKPHKYTEQTMSEGLLKKIEEDLLEVTGLAFEISFNKALNQ